MNDTRCQIVSALFALVPYILVSWTYMALANGSTREFWGAFGVLVGTRVFFGVIETFGSVITWRLYGKKLMVSNRSHPLKKDRQPNDLYELVAELSDDLTDAARCT